MNQENYFLEKIKGLLDESTENLDSRTQQRLEEMRINALSAVEEKQLKFRIPFRWIMAGSFATAAVAVVAVFFWLSNSPGEFPVKHAEDFEIIASGDKVDLYQNLDFYRWLAGKGNGTEKGKTL